MWITCYWWAADEGGYFTVPPDQMLALGEQGLDLEFELSFYRE